MTTIRYLCLCCLALVIGACRPGPLFLNAPLPATPIAQSQTQITPPATSTLDPSVTPTITTTPDSNATPTATPEDSASTTATPGPSVTPSITPTPVALIYAPTILKNRLFREYLFLPLLLQNIASLQQVIDRNPAPFDPSTTAITLVPVVDGLTNVTGVTNAGDGSGRLFVLEKAGTIRVVKDGELLPQPFLDVTTLVKSDGYEQGLIGLTFHPQYQTTGYLFIDYTNQDGNVVIARYHISDDYNIVDPTTAKILLTISKPFSQHNGGQLAFGRDGYLYIGIGDGGDGGDPFLNGQNINSLLGKILRIDVDQGDPYAIPPSNPFVGRNDARPEIWAYGLRNPWRFSFDRLTGDMYIGDVGQEGYEEVDMQPANTPGGVNYGWNLMEGFHCYRPAVGCEQPGLTLPIFEYPHTGCDAIVGGYVYRGYIQPLVGAYLYADECQGNIWALSQQNGQWISTQVMTNDLLITSFGEDEVGEIYAANFSPGAIYRVVAVPRTP